jgi:molecular chaperone DnaK
MEKTVNDNREKVGAVATEVEAAIAEAKTALQEGGIDKLNDAFNKLQASSHKLAEALYQQTATPDAGTESTSDQASAAGASSGGGDDNVIDAEYVDVDEKK